MGLERVRTAKEVNLSARDIASSESSQCGQYACAICVATRGLCGQDLVVDLLTVGGGGSVDTDTKVAIPKAAGVMSSRSLRCSCLGARLCWRLVR